MVSFAATYALVWVALAGYVGWMSSRQRRLAEQYARLQQRFAEAEAAEIEDVETEDVIPLRRAA